MGNFKVVNIDYDEIYNLIIEYDSLENNNLTEDAKYNLNLKAKGITDSINLEEFYMREIIELETNSISKSLDYYYDEISKLEKDSINENEYNQKQIELDQGIANQYRNDNSEYCNALKYYDYNNVKTIEEKYSKISVFLESITRKKYPYIEGLRMIENFRIQTEMSIIYREIFLWLKNGKKQIKDGETSTIKSLKDILNDKSKYDLIINFLLENSIIRKNENNLEWTGPKNDTSLKAKTSLCHFAVYLFKENYLIKSSDKDLVSILSNEFNLEIYATNYSKIRDRVSTGAENRKEIDYQELFYNLP